MVMTVVAVVAVVAVMTMVVVAVLMAGRRVIRRPRRKAVVASFRLVSMVHMTAVVRVLIRMLAVAAALLRRLVHHSLRRRTGQR